MGGRGARGRRWLHGRDGGPREARPEAHGRANAGLRVLLKPPRGKGAAVRAGMLAAQGDYWLFADADLATPPDQLPLLRRRSRSNDLALGSRVHPDGTDRRRRSPFIDGCWAALPPLAAVWVTGPCPTRSVASRVSGARPRRTSSPASSNERHRLRRGDHPPGPAPRLLDAVVPVQWSDKRGSRMRLRPGLARVLLDLVRIPLVHRAAPRAQAHLSGSGARVRLLVGTIAAPKSSGSLTAPHPPH